MAKDTEKGSQWVAQALAGVYDYGTGGAGKKGKRPGFSKAGSIGAKQDKKMKGSAPTHGGDGKA